jgi:DNA-binding MarR family transcriptional regulator
LVDSLVRLGLVERANDPHDRRVNRVRILSKGEKLLKDLLPGYYKHIHDICSIFTAAEKKKLNDLLTRLRNRMSKIKG